MTLVAGGDSFIWGSELSDHKHGGADGFSRLTFSALLSNDYICAAYPGIGNVEIAKRVLKLLQPTHKLLVSWTWPSRDNHINSDASILEVQNYCVKHNIKYMFTCADNCLITNNNQINYNNWFFFPPGQGANKTTTPRGFYQWAVEEGFKCGADGHPLDYAHSIAAQLMRNKFLQLTV